MELGTVKVDWDTNDGHIDIEWNWIFIVSSLAISLVGSWRFLQSMREITERRLTSFLPCGFVYGACAVWSLHFTAMNSIYFGKDAQGNDIQVRYSVPWVAASVFFPFMSATFSSYLLFIVRRKARKSYSTWVRETSAESALSSENGDMPWCGLLSKRRLLFSCMSGVSMTLGIATMHYSGHIAMTNIRQVHPLWGIGLVAVSCLVLNLVAAWLASNPRDSFCYNCTLSIVITLAVAVPHYTSAHTVRYYLDDSLEPGGLLGGPHSSIQDMVFVANFIVGTLIFNMVSAYRSQRKISKLTKDLHEASTSSLSLSLAAMNPEAPPAPVEEAKVAEGIGGEQIDKVLEKKFSLIVKELDEGEMTAISRNIDTCGKQYLTSGPYIVVVNTPRNDIRWSGCRTPDLVGTPRLPSPAAEGQWDVLKPLERWGTPFERHGAVERESTRLPQGTRFTTPRPLP